MPTKSTKGAKPKPSKGMGKKQLQHLEKRLHEERARVMNLGIIILLIPPVLILVGFMVLCYKRRKTYAEPPPEFKPAALELEEVLAGDRR